MAQIKVTRTLALAIGFVFQLALGSLAFLALYLIAVCLSLAISFISKWTGVSAAWLLNASDYVEIAIFGVDVIAFGFFVISELAHFVRALFGEWADANA